MKEYTINIRKDGSAVIDEIAGIFVKELSKEETEILLQT